MVDKKPALINRVRSTECHHWYKVFNAEVRIGEMRLSLVLRTPEVRGQLIWRGGLKGTLPGAGRYLITAGDARQTQVQRFN